MRYSVASLVSREASVIIIIFLLFYLSANQKEKRIINEGAKIADEKMKQIRPVDWYKCECREFENQNVRLRRVSSRKSVVNLIGRWEEYEEKGVHDGIIAFGWFVSLTARGVWQVGKIFVRGEDAKNRRMLSN